MSAINFIASNISYLNNEGFDIPDDFLDQVKTTLDNHDVFYDEINQDVALRNETPSHMIPIMNALFEDRFICKYLSHIYQNSEFNHDETSFYPKYIFLKTERVEFIETTLNGKPLLIGDLHTLHQEISALGNALGIVLSERDNYPGGKQKIAFQLIDISWSAINSSMPLIIF